MTRCPSCGHENTGGAKFCNQCAADLALVCASCQKHNDSNSRFCAGCGEQLRSHELESPGSEVPRAPVPSTIADGRYRIERLLGEGGKKRVYLAHDDLLDSQVAIAFIKTDGLGAEDLHEVRREAQAMGRLRDHPNIVTVHDVGDESGQPYIVEEFMQGGSLEELLRHSENHRLPLEDTLRICQQVCEGLDYAHGRGIIHRDIKPGNIWFASAETAGTGQGQSAKLGDFGLAVAIDRSRVTPAGLVLGTAAYLPPEFAVGASRDADARSDLYSLGATLYEMVTGRPPFLGDDVLSIISQHINTAPVAPSWHNRDVPRPLETLIMRLLAKPQDERPQSAANVREELAAIASATSSSSSEQLVALDPDANPLDSLAGGVFVGRKTEMDELRAGLEAAISGHGRLMMLVGEPGIGKTRTADEFATYARLRNAQVLWGRCYEGEGAPAFWPWVQIIRSYVYDRDLEELKSEMGSGAADIAQFVSEVRERLPDLPESAELKPKQARFRLFDSTTTFFRNAAKRQPLVLVLDDLHWADKTSLLLLQFLVRELEGTRILVIGTYRDADLGRKHPLTQTLGELNTEQLSHRISMRQLAEADVARFIEMMAGVEPPAELAAAVYRQTEGNPFFVSEVVRLLVSDGHLYQPLEDQSWSVTIPQEVREAVGRRLDHLSEECNQVLMTASVIGRDFGLETLERVSDVRGERVLVVLDEAISARIVDGVSGVVRQYRFSHALIRDALYEDLGVSRRVQLHGRIGEVLEDIHSGTSNRHVAELANHFFQAAQSDADRSKAIDYARMAAELAIEHLAYDEAVGNYEKALQAQENMLKPDNHRLGELLLSLGDAQWKAGNVPAAKRTYFQAVELARAKEDADQLARAALGVAGPWGEYEVDDSMVASLLTEALDTLSLEDSGLRARLMSSLAVVLYWTDWLGSVEERDSLSKGAIEMARRTGEQAAVLYAVRARHIASWNPDNLEERLTLATEGLRMASAVRDVPMVLNAHLGRVVDLLELGDIDGADSEIEVYSELANKVRTPEDLWHVASFEAMRALFDGRFQEAEELAQGALEIGQKRKVDDVIVGFGCQMLLLRWEQGRLGELEPIAKNFVQQFPKVPGWRSLLSWLYSEIGRKPEAQEELDRLAANGFGDIPRDWWWLNSLSMLAESCALLGDEDHAAQLYDSLLPYGERNVGVTGFICFGPCSRFLGILARTMGRWDEAQRHFERAIAHSASMATKPWEARSQYSYASMLIAKDGSDDTSKAMELLDQARSTAQDLDMTGLLEKISEITPQVQAASPDDVTVLWLPEDD